MLNKQKRSKVWWVVLVVVCIFHCLCFSSGDSDVDQELMDRLTYNKTGLDHAFIWSPIVLSMISGGLLSNIDGIGVSSGFSISLILTTFSPYNF